MSFIWNSGWNTGSTAISGGSGGGAVDSVFGRTGVILPVAGDYTATDITVISAGDISSTNVGAAIFELDGDINTLRSGVAAISGNLQSQIDLKADITTVAAISGDLQSGITKNSKRVITVKYTSPAVNDKEYIEIPYNLLLTKWTMLADISGSAVVDVWKDTYANYPPTVADTITASEKPTLTNTNKNNSSTLTGWTTSISGGDILMFNVDSISTITKLEIQLEGTIV